MKSLEVPLYQAVRTSSASFYKGAEKTHDSIHFAAVASPVSALAPFAAEVPCERPPALSAVAAWGVPVFQKTLLSFAPLDTEACKAQVAVPLALEAEKARTSAPFYTEADKTRALMPSALEAQKVLLPQEMRPT